MSNNFWRDMVKSIADENTNMLEDGLNSSEFSGWIDTGSYTLNALLSGTIYGGIPNNKIVAFAGEEATGKTFFVLGLVKKFLEENPTAGVFYYDSEAAVTKKMMKDRGIDVSRIIIAEPTTVEEFRTHAMRVLDNYIESDKKTRPKLMMVLDSLGMLSTDKEVKDITDDKRNQKGDATKDMTRPGLIRAAFRTLSLRAARAGVTFLVTNHTYDKIGSTSHEREMGGGSGLKYAASQIIFLSKRKETEGSGSDKEVIGNIIHCKNKKNRITKENEQIDVRLSYSKGLERYYGLVELATEAGIFKKLSTQYQLPDGRKIFEKVINNNPEKYYTKEILDAIDKYAAERFCYGEGELPDEEEDDAEGSEESEATEV